MQQVTKLSHLAPTGSGLRGQVQGGCRLFLPVLSRFLPSGTAVVRYISDVVQDSGVDKGIRFSALARLYAF